MSRKGHICPNRFSGEGANGGCFFTVGPSDRQGIALLTVGWSCCVVHDDEIPVTWLAEVIAIATAHTGGIAGFLAEHNYKYALQCDPVESKKQ